MVGPLGFEKNRNKVLCVGEEEALGSRGSMVGGFGSNYGNHRITSDPEAQNSPSYDPAISTRERFKKSVQIGWWNLLFNGASDGFSVRVGRWLGP